MTIEGGSYALESRRHAGGVGAVLPPESPAFAHGERLITRGQAAARGNRLARALLDRGAKPGDKVAFYMRNKPAYLELLGACWKARLTHVNVNYRYRPDEVAYIVENSDSVALVYDAEFREAVAAIRGKLPLAKIFLEVDGGSARADFAEDFEEVCETGDPAPLRLERSPGDLFFLYTGGTTGLPKGVMWEHGALRETQMAAARKLGPIPRPSRPGPRTCPSSGQRPRTFRPAR